MVTIATHIPTNALGISNAARADSSRASSAAQHNWFSADTKAPNARHIGISPQKLQGDVDQLAQKVLAHISQQTDTSP